jgi:hypothetical protein
MTAAILIAVVVGAIGNLAAIIGFALQLTNRIDGLGARLDSRIDSLGEAFIRHDHGARP